MRKRQAPTDFQSSIDASKRLSRELQLLRHDFEVALCTPTEDNVMVLQERAWMVQRQMFALHDMVNEMCLAISLAKTQPAPVRERQALTLAAGGRP